MGGVWIRSLEREAGACPASGAHSVAPPPPFFRESWREPRVSALCPLCGVSSGYKRVILSGGMALWIGDAFPSLLCRLGGDCMFVVLETLDRIVDRRDSGQGAGLLGCADAVECYFFEESASGCRSHCRPTAET